MVVRAISCKSFNNYTAVLEYTTAVEKEFKYNLITYSCDIFFRVILNDYKVIYKVYDPR